jgi:hypothetical protein
MSQSRMTDHPRCAILESGSCLAAGKVRELLEWRLPCGNSVASCTTPSAYLQRGSAGEEAEVEGMAGLAKSNGSSATRKAIDEAHVAQQVIHDQD